MADERPLILVTCDDGVRSPGLVAAVRAVLPLADVIVAAPREQQTGAGRSIPAIDDGSIERVDCVVDGQPVPAFTLHASPAQVVLYALTELVPRKPALCVSGINFGENVGNGVTVSGTIGAAMEAASDGIPALAASLETDKIYHHQPSEKVDFTAATHFTRYFAARLLDRPLPPDVDLLKLDVPASATLQTPWRVTRISRQRYFRAVPSGRRLLADRSRLGYEMFVDYDELEPDSDVHALRVDRVVSITPVSLDLTSRLPLDGLDTLLRATKEKSSGR